MDSVTLVIQNDPVISVNGHLVTASFSAERNDAVTEQIKKTLISSYSEKIGDSEVLKNEIGNTEMKRQLEKQDEMVDNEQEQEDLEQEEYGFQQLAM